MSRAEHQIAALSLVNVAPLTPKEGSFCGQMVFADEMSAKQRHWLEILLERHGLPPIGAASDFDRRH